MGESTVSGMQGHYTPGFGAHKRIEKRTGGKSQTLCDGNRYLSGISRRQGSRREYHMKPGYGDGARSISSQTFPVEQFLKDGRFTIAFDRNGLA